MSSIFYRKYQEQKAKAPPRKISEERLRQNALSAPGGLAARPKDFDWLDKNIPCQAACPAKTDIPGYLDAIAHGDYETAYRINLRDNVFPAVLGRVCTRPCEPACRHGWAGLGEPVAICFSKRSAADFLEKTEPITLSPYFPATGRKVAVVGAGAAGLSAARELALHGHQVVVFEKHRVPGGLMVQGIPHFRLPRAIVEREVEQVRRCGVEIRCGEALGEHVKLETLLADFDAVILAAGTYQPNRTGINGSERSGVRHGLDFLRAVNAGEKVPVGARVVVIGGGFTAVDCARTARRLGATDVRMMYRRSESEMYITPGEVEEMKNEGIQFETLVAPLRINGADGCVSSVTFARTEMGAPDAHGRRQFKALANKEFEVPADTVLLATGQQPDVALSESARRHEDAKLFRAGDFSAGASSLIEAIADGKSIAQQVDEFLMGWRRRGEAALIEEAEATGRTREMDNLPRQEMPTLPGGDRSLQAEVESGFSEEAARTEARRCYLCSYKYEIDNDLCIYCDRCLKVKPMENCIVKVQSLVHDGEGRITGYLRSTGSKDYNMLFIDQAQCIRCGACKDVCPVECITLQKVSRVGVNNKEAGK